MEFTSGNKCIRKFFAAIVVSDTTIGVKLELYVTEFDVVNRALSVLQEARTQAFLKPLSGISNASLHLGFALSAADRMYALAGGSQPDADALQIVTINRVRKSTVDPHPKVRIHGDFSVTFRARFRTIKTEKYLFLGTSRRIVTISNTLCEVFECAKVVR